MKPFCILILSLVSLLAYGQKIDDVFKTMPDKLLPGLPDGTRTLLLVDTINNPVPYPLGSIEKLQYNDSYLNLKTSDVGTTQIKLLPLINNSKIVCLIKTVCSNGCDSQISFYSTDWEELESDTLLSALGVESFFDSSRKGKDNYNFALSLPHFFPISARFADGTDDLTLTFDYASILSPEMVNEIRPYIKSDTIVLKWNKTRFR